MMMYLIFEYYIESITHYLLRMFCNIYLLPTVWQAEYYYAVGKFYISEVYVYRLPIPNICNYVYTVNFYFSIKFDNF